MIEGSNPSGGANFGVKMKVRLISYSQPIITDYAMSAQDLVAYCARVSNPDNQMNKESSGRLIKYLIKHKHWSPFEMVSACLEIQTTRDIARQILRHRSFSFQEFSQRYAIADSFEFREARLQDKKNRQNSIDIEDATLQANWKATQAGVLDSMLKAYNWALDNGIAKEQARVVLPEGLTHSILYMNGTLRSWIHYVQLRTDPSTQKEHREVAEACKKEIATIFPIIDDL